jgi:hypothetical protein
MASLPTIEQHPGFKLIRVTGSPAECGLQHGRLLRDEIRLLRSIFYHQVIYRNGPALGLALRSVMAPMLLAMQRHIPTDLRLEMRGIARGAGVPYWDILLFNCFDDLLHSLWLIPQFLARFPILRSRLACSSFSVHGSRTTGGHLLHGRNLDYEVVGGIMSGDGAVTKALKEHVVVIEYRPDRGHQFLSVGWPGVAGVVTSLNAPGLSLACLTSTVWGETPNGLPLPLLYRCISQYADTLERGEALIRAARLTIGNNLHLASGASDESRVYELSPHGVAVREAADGALVATNHFVDASMTQRQTGWVVPASLDRHTRLQSLCASTLISPEDATAFLRDAECLAPDGSLWSCLENPGTVYSTVTEPASGRIWIRTVDQPDRPFVEVSARWSQQAASIQS